MSYLLLVKFIESPKIAYLLQKCIMEMKLGQIINYFSIFNVNKQIITRYITGDQLFIMTYLFKDDFIIMKKFWFQHLRGYWVIFQDFQEDEIKKFKNYTSKELKRQFKYFLTRNLKENDFQKEKKSKKSKNLFVNYHLKNLKVKGIEITRTIKNIVILPPLNEIFL